MGLTKRQFQAKVRELMQKSTADAVEKAGIAYEDHVRAKVEIPDNYVAAKAFVIAYTDRMKWDWSPQHEAAGWKGWLHRMKARL